jgi:hypothetical protein
MTRPWPSPSRRPAAFDEETPLAEAAFDGDDAFDEDAPAEADPVPDAAFVAEALGDDEDFAAGGFAVEDEAFAEPALASVATPAVYSRPAPVTLHVSVAMPEVEKLVAQLRREWRAAGLEPTVEDVVLRAAGRAAGEAGMFEPPIAGLVAAWEGVETFAFLEGAGHGPFREHVAALAAARGGGAYPVTACILTSLASFGVDGGATPLEEEHAFGLTLGASAPRASGGEAVPAAALSLTYRPDMLTVGEAAAILSRTRDLVEAPYALLAD